MNYRDRSLLDAGHWAFYGLQQASWGNRALSALNVFNPLDHPWNFDSATVAKHRLRAVTRSDRAACNDGKWVRMPREPGFWCIQMKRGEVYLRGKRAKDAAEVKRYFKPRYRWEIRR